MSTRKKTLRTGVTHNNTTMGPKPSEGKARGRYQKMPVGVSIYLRYLHQDLGVPGKHLVKQFLKYSRTAIYHQMKQPIDAEKTDRRKFNPGRPQILSERNRRLILRQVPLLRKAKRGAFSLRDIRNGADVPKVVSDTTVRRVLHKDGYKCRQSAHKGVLSETDTKKRYKFARAIKKDYPADVWWNCICFYLDGTGFAYKVNPCDHAMRSTRCTRRVD